MTAFLAYPSRPPELLMTIREALGSVPSEAGIVSWETNDIAGRFIEEPIVEKILAAKHFIADTTYYNFNVFYEIGFAIAHKKRPILIKNAALTGDDRTSNRTGLLDSIGNTKYRNSSELAAIFSNLPDSTVNLVRTSKKDRDQPVFYLRTPTSVDFDVITQSRLKKARLGFRVYDPEETGPLTAAEAIDNVAQSFGVVLHLLPSTFEGSREHNLWMAFVAGLSHGFGALTKILQTGTDPVPLDYRNLVTPWQKLDQIEGIIGDFGPEVYERLQQSRSQPNNLPATGLSRINLGSSSAENEFGELEHYFIQTDEYRRILRGEVHVAVGRKGSGKTALFAQTRNSLRRNRKNIVLDLQPEGAQLLKIKDLMLSLLQKGTKEHTVVAFWEYLLLLEICHKLLHKDHQLHLVNHQLYSPYRKLEKIYGASGPIREGDFAERMLSLIESISETFARELSADSSETTLSRARITQLLHKHDIRDLRECLVEYLKLKDDVWILFDNLDKGWSAFGVGADDILLLRCLQDALIKLRQDFERSDISCRSTLFLRNDILSLMVNQTPDRGKIAIVPIDWDDPEMLRELLRRRLSYSLNGTIDLSFTDVWGQVFLSHYKNEESSQYLVDRSLMRPRALIDLVQRCIAHAINVGHARVEAEDIEHGEHSYSSHLVDQIGYEIRDVMPNAEDVLYSFIGAPQLLSTSELYSHLQDLHKDIDRERMIEILMWYGVLGILRQDSSEPMYIHDVRYDIKRLKSLTQKYGDSLVYCFNPAFHRGLDVDS